MKVILTGANGNLGQHIQKLKEFDEVNPVVRNNWEQLLHIPENKYDAVIHAASDLKNNIHVNPAEVLDSNLITTARLLKLCSQKKIKKFVFISSCSVYGESSNSSEDIACHPITLNGETKYFNEALIKSYCNANHINYLILRVFNSYGGNDHFSVLNKLINCAKNKTPFTLYNEGSAERDFIYIEDVAKITCQLTKLINHNEVLNVGTGESVKIRDILSAVETKFGTIKKEIKENLNETPYSRANIKKLKKIINFETKNIINYITNL